MWVTSEPLDVEDAKAALERKVKDLDEYIEKGQIEILDCSQWYTKSGMFESDRVLQGWVEKEGQALQRGFDGIRLTGNTLWVEGEDWEAFTAYEAAVDNVIGQYRMLAVCTYSLSKCGAGEVIDVISNHRFSLIRREGRWEMIESAERKRMEDMWRSEYEFSENMINAATDTIFVFDLSTGQPIRWNKAFTEISGFSNEEIASKKAPDEWYSEEDLEKTKTENGKLLRGEKSIIEMSLITKCGQRIPTEYTASMIKDAEGNPRYIIAVGRDISERKQVEKALQESEEKYRNLFEYANDMIFIIEPQTYRYLHVNESAVRHLGYSREELLQLSLGDINMPMAAEQGEVLLRKMQETGNVTVEHIYRRKDDTELPVEISTRAIQYGDQHVWQSIVRDITERVQAEQVLWESEEKYHTLFDNEPDAIILVDEDTGELVDANPIAEELYGYAREELLQMKAWDLSAEPEEICKVIKIIDQKGPVHVPIRKHKKKDGTVFTVEISAGHCRIGERNINISMIRDITERVQAEQVLWETTHLLETVLEHTHVLVAYMDPQFNFIMVNQAYAEGDKRPPSFFPGKNHFDLYPNEENEAIFQRVVETGEPYFAYAKPFEYAEHPKRGVSYWDWSLVPIKAPGGTVGAVLLTVANVTERVRAEQEIQNLAKFPSENPNPVMRISQEGTLIYANPACLSQFPGWDLQVWQTAPAILLEVVTQVMQNGTAKQFDLEYGERLYSFSIAPIVEVGYANLYARDITESPQIKALRTAEANYRAIFEHAPVGIYQSTPEGRYLSVNPTMTRMFGFKSTKEMLANITDIASQIYVDPIQQKEFQRQIDEHGYVLDFVCQQYRKDGSRLWISNNARVVTDEDGKILHYDGFLTDITQQVEAHTALRRHTEHLDAMREIGMELMTQLELEKVLHSIVVHSVELLAGNGGGLYLHNSERDVLEWSVAVHPDSAPIGTTLRRGEGLSGKVLEKDVPLIVEDYKHWEGRAAFFEDYPRTAIVAVPVRWGEKFLGVLNVLSDTPGAFFVDDAELLSLFANQAAVAINNARLFAAEQQQRAEVERTNKLISVLAQVATRVQSAPDPATAMETLGTELTKLELDCTVAAFDPDDSALVVKYASIGSKALSAIEKITNRPILGFRLARMTIAPYIELVEHHRAIVASGSEAVSFVTDVLPGFTRPVIKRILKLAGVQPDTVAIFLPLIIEDRMLGAFCLWGQDLQEADLPVFATFASQMSITLENARLFEQVHLGRERLQTLSHRLVEAQESERRGIAIELHDEVGQNLTALKLHLEYTLNIPADTETTNAQLREAGEMVDDISRKVQVLSLNLRPSMLDDLGILPTLRWHIDRFESQTRIKVDFEQRGIDRRFSMPTELTVYRVVQEALTNVARYADVDQVIVRVWIDLDIIYIQVEDHGAGFDTADVFSSQDSVGLLGMNERLVLLGGRLNIDSSPGEGTTVMAVLPLEGIVDRRIHER